MTHLNTTTRRLAVGAAGLLVAAAALAGCANSTTSSSASGSVKEIRIGLIFPTTGSMAALGNAQEAGAKLVLDWANQHGGIDGAKIKTFEGDSQSNPGVGATVAQQLIDQDQVQIIIGSYASGIAQAIAPVAQRNKVLLWEIGAVAPNVAQAGDNYFIRTLGASGTYAAADLDFLKNYLAAKIGKSVDQLRVAVAHEDGPFGTSVADAIVAQGKALNLNIVTDIAYPETSTDLTPVVLKLKAAQPDVLLMTPLVASTMVFWQDAKTQNLDVKAVIGSAGYSSSTFLKKFGAKGVEGVYDVEAPSVQYMNDANLSPDAKAMLDTIRTEYQQQTGNQCLVHCGDGIGGAYILVKDVLPRAVASGSVTADSVRAAAAKTDIPVGGTPQGFGAKFDANGDNTLAESVIMQWHDGVLNVVWPSALAAAQPIYPMPTWSQR